MNKDKMQLTLSAITKGLSGLVVLMLLLFLPAGTWHYTGAWLLIAILFVPMLLMGIVMIIKSPELLRRRLASKEQRSQQQGVIRFSGLIFVAGFIIAALDFRFGWSQVPQWLVYSAALLFIIGYALYGEVMRENVWLSRTVNVEKEQNVITTGLYGIVRHPMYTATLLMFLSMPLVLGSYWACAVFFFYLPIIVARIIDEEQLLHSELKGYTEYCQQTRWRLFPFVW